ncbi:MAG TPA: glycosyltransferase [Burkholderiaceae bacterium]|jgi:UDP-N-acetylmuramyl pentapeptide phosphotransferase/UDP-N-acetylglucosamine-1-phosphate transferase|nr:glycosyltransferase [Burkholderiaceae bacterium]
MIVFLVSFMLSAALTLLVVRLLRHRGSAAKDHDRSGPQKFHVTTVARVGGVAVFGALAALALVSARAEAPLARELVLLLACGLPVFAMGLLEDLTKRVSPVSRLGAAAVSALLAVFVLGTVIDRTDIWGLDLIASTAAGAVALAVLAVAGISNAINIIDGFNGLASMCAEMIFLALAYVAFQVGDTLVFSLALAGAGAVLGFFIWNYPAGLIFLGDGGAYFIGFMAAVVALLLLQRNPQVSPLFPLLACIYPVFETLFSMYRRKVIRGRSVGMPDGLHLHSLVYRRMLRWAIGREDAAVMMKRNSRTAPYLWLLCMFAVVPAVLFWDNSLVLGACIVLFALAYIVLYVKIIRFKVPGWMVSKR